MKEYHIPMWLFVTLLVIAIAAGLGLGALLDRLTP